jgi:2OG-Fe(II) oxygenase superfamily
MDVSEVGTLDLPLLPVVHRPFPHVSAHDFLSSERYRQLLASFPACPPSSGPTGFSCFRGDPAYERLIAKDEAWSWLYRACQSQAFVSYCLRQFAAVWPASGCLIAADRARYVDYCESRLDKERRYLEKIVHAPEELWVRLDFLKGHIGYRRALHRDHCRRLLTMLIYFCDATQNEMTGGNLCLHGQEADEFTVDRAFAPEHNLMVAFPRVPHSFHSVDEIKHQCAARNFLQITVSSSVDAWPS